jgi:excisionase family DNA binding protein
MPEQPPIAPLLLDAPAAARALSISVRTLHRLVAAGDIRPVFVGRLTRFPFAALEHFALTRQQPQRPVKVNTCRQAPQPVAAVGVTP